MKLQDGVITAPDTGICEIDINKIAKCFGMSTISRWHDKYRLCNQRAHLKVTISPKKAAELIDRLNLIEVPSGIFANASTFMTRERLQKAYGPKETSK